MPSRDIVDMDDSRNEKRLLSKEQMVDILVEDARKKFNPWWGVFLAVVFSISISVVVGVPLLASSVVSKGVAAAILVFLLILGFSCTFLVYSFWKSKLNKRLDAIYRADVNMLQFMIDKHMRDNSGDITKAIWGAAIFSNIFKRF